MTTLVTKRTPSEVTPPRMETLARLPVFFALEGRRTVVAGGTAAAAWKAELLSAAGAWVDVYSPEPSEELAALAVNPPRGAVVLHRRGWTAEDLSGAAIAVGACGSDDEAERFRAAAGSRAVPINVVDKPQYCDFSFGAIINRSPLVIGVSTDGAAPVFGQAIRAKLESLIPRGFVHWAEAARHWRDELRVSGLTFDGRRWFWQRFSELAITNPNRAPQPSDYDRLLADAAAERERVELGSVTLVGAGPGDPELLTLRAVRALQSADVILFDDLVSAEVLEFARREAKKMLVGKTGHAPSCKQDEINSLMVTLARSGRRVVRLKGGDPMVFGRADEEIAACRNAGISVEVVAGITAAQGAASRLGVSLTHRKEARRLQYVTGHAADGRLPPDLDWRSLSDPGVTTAIYMPARTISAFAEKAVSTGLDPATPAVAISRVTRPDEQRIMAPIADLAEQLASVKLPGPVLVLIGWTLAASVQGGASLDTSLDAQSTQAPTNHDLLRAGEGSNPV